MKEYRPPDWERIITETLKRHAYLTTIRDKVHFRDGIEAGASAVLKALKPLILEIAPANRLVDILYKEKEGEDRKSH